MRKQLLSLMVILSCSAASLLLAQDGAPPTFSGKGKVTDAINGKLGAVFDIGGGITMSFPRGLPVGESRLVTLQKGRGSVPAKLVHARFRGVGPVLDFSGAFTTGREPIVLSVPMKRDPTGKNQKLVVAMEIGTFCEDKNKEHKLNGGLCSGFELHDAQYDSEAKSMTAALRSTGGLRMQFGLVPLDEDAK